MTRDITPRRATTLVAVCLIAFALIGIVLGATVTLTEGAHLNASDGPEVELGHDLEIDTNQPFPDNNTVALPPHITLQSNGTTSVGLEAVNETDEWAEFGSITAGASNLSIDHAQSERIVVDGTFDSLRVRSIADRAAPGTNERSLYYDSLATSSPSIQIHDLDSLEGEKLVAYDWDTDEILDWGNVSNGSVTFGLPEGDYNVSIESSDDDSGGGGGGGGLPGGPIVEKGPTITDVEPADGTTVTSSATLNATIRNEDHPDVATTVRFYGNGTLLHEETITSNSTVSTEWTGIDGGENDWRVEAIDETGREASVGRSLRAAMQLNIYNESGTLIDETIEAEVLATADGSNYRETRTITDGQTKFGEVPDEQLLVKLNASGYEPRQMLINEPYGQKEKATVLYAEEADPVFDQCFTLDSRGSGFSPSESWLLLQIHIDGEWRDAAGGYFGAANTHCMTLTDGEEYRLVVESDDDRRSLGGYSGDQSFSDSLVPLTVEGIDLSLDRGTTYSWEVALDRELDDEEELVGGDIIFRFAANDRDVEDLEVLISNRSDRDHVLTLDRLEGEVNSYVATYPVPDEHLNTTWIVEWEATVDGELVDGSQTVNLEHGPTSTGWGPLLTALLAAGFLLVIAGIFGMVHAPVGAVVVAATAGLFSMMGLVSLPTLILSVALALAILGYIAAKTRGGI